MGSVQCKSNVCRTGPGRLGEEQSTHGRYVAEVLATDRRDILVTICTYNSSIMFYSIFVYSLPYNNDNYNRN
jgi:hypothetical protein